MKKWQSHPLFRFFSSLKLAVLVILSLAAVLSVATVFESLYGMRGAHLLVYGQPWFHGVLILLATNVFCAALSRFPWKRHQTGFVVTHTGILILLFGSWVTMRFGVDGNLPVVEGSEEGQVILNDLRLIVTDSDSGNSQSFPVPESARKKEGRLLQLALSDSDELSIGQFLPRARMRRVVEKSPVGIGTPAVQVELFNDRFSIMEWILASNPDGPTELNVGPAVLSFRKLSTPRDEQAFREGKMQEALPKQGRKGFVVVKISGKEYRVDIDEAMSGWKPVGASGYNIVVDKYLPYAIVKNNQLVNRSNKPVNPTVQVRIRNGAGLEEKHTLFANFPDFGTLHRKSMPNNREEFKVQMRMIASNGQESNAGVRGRLFLGQTSGPKPKLLYRIWKGTTSLGHGELESGKEVATGWMDLRLRVANWIPAASSFERPEYVDRVTGTQNFPAAVQVGVTGSRRPASSDTAWLVEGSSMAVPAGDKILQVSFSKDRLELPFKIHLNKFTMGTDPGTDKPATYESEVTVADPENPQAPDALISMNDPLDYGGYTFYQASYQLREGEPPISVFSVNYDPGRPIKYLGSLTMVLGIILMFWLNPHYWDILLGRKRRA